MKKFSVMLAVVLLLLVPPGIQNNDLTDIILKEPVEVEKIDSAKFANITIPFIENQGQIDEQVKFYAKTFAGTVYVTNNDLTYHSILKKNDLTTSTVVKENFVDGTIIPSGTESSHTVVNYFKGTEENWRTNIPTYSEISLGQVWNDVDVSLKAYGNNLEKIFTIHPYGDVSIIRANFDGITNLSISDSDELIVDTINGKFFLSKPVAFQNINGITKNISASYEIIDSTTYGFSVEQYDHTYDLVIDPIIAATFLGGSGADSGEAIDTDDSGNVYVASITTSSDFPTTSGASDETHNGGIDVAISKFTSDLSTLTVSTFIGGAQDDKVLDIDIDSSGNVFIVGFTKNDNTTDYPNTISVIQTTLTTDIGNETTAFISKFPSNLSTLTASTFIGEADPSDAFAIAIDGSGNIFITGAGSSTYPVTEGAFDESFNGGSLDVVVSKISNNLTILLASTFLGSDEFDGGDSIDFDSSGNVYVTGETAGGSSTLFPTTGGAFTTDAGGSTDGFVTKFDSNLSSSGGIVSSLLGGSGADNPIDIHVAQTSGDVYVVGFLDSSSTDFPVTSAIFLSEFGSSGVSESKFSNAQGVAVDDTSGNIIVADSGQNRVQIFDSSGNFVSMFGFGVNGGGAVFENCTSSCSVGVSGAGTGQFNFPTGVAVDGSSRIIVADNGNDRIQVFDSSGNFVSMFGFGVNGNSTVFENCTSSCSVGSTGSGDGQFSSIELIEVDSSDNIYVADAGNDRIQKFSSTGSTFILDFGSNGVTAGLFDLPHDVVINSSGKIIVADASNNRVQIFTSPVRYSDNFFFCFFCPIKFARLFFFKS